MKNNFLIVGIVVACVIGLAGVGFGLRLWNVNADRMVFKQSVVYNEGIIDDLAKYKFEMQSADEESEKKAICELVNSRFANFDESKIENDDLKQFLNNCRNGELN